MQHSLAAILTVQELDMKMLRLMRLKQERQKEMTHIGAIKADLTGQLETRRHELMEIKKEMRLLEGRNEELKERMQKLEAQQSAVKKVDEFNALTHEMSAVSKERHSIDQQLGEMSEKLTAHEEVAKTAESSLKTTQESSATLEKEIDESIREINSEGRRLAAERKEKQVAVPAEIFKIYERLFYNKKDRVVVPIENRTCSGCHILVTAQHENVVRKGERLVFCEHCSRLHYWQEAQAAPEGEEAPVKRRRRRATVVQ